MKEALTIEALPAVSGRGLREAIGEVWRLLKRGIEFPIVPHTPLHNELRELAAPHLPLLVYKRGKISQTRGPLDDEQWFGELSDFVSRMLWPHLEQNPMLGGRTKNSVTEMLDEIVACEQQFSVEAALADVLPRTSRFDTSWAT